MIKVLVVEDEEIAAEAHREYVQRVPGFSVAGVARTGAEALRFLSAHEVDLVLLDLYLPDLHGLELCRRIRGRPGGHLPDVIAVTSARDLGAVRTAVSIGVVQYLLKPFSFAMMRDKLQRYARYREALDVSGELTGQDEVDSALAALRGSVPGRLPKGMSTETLEAVVGALKRVDGSHSATEVGEQLGMSRVTARRYLEYLVDSGLAGRAPQYGSAGRPELRYRWLAGSGGA